MFLSSDFMAFVDIFTFTLTNTIIDIKKFKTFKLFCKDYADFGLSWNLLVVLNVFIKNTIDYDT